MAQTFEFTSKYGTNYEIVFTLAEYMNGNTAVIVDCRNIDEDDDYWDLYGDLTTNLGMPFGRNYAFLDTNNLQDLCDFVLMHGWAEVTDHMQSGFCTYPLVRFTDEFLDEICEKGEYK